MNNNKIAFITCVKNVEQYERMIKYIQALIVPVSYYVEIITITEEINIALAYNQAINVTDAKYKIYIIDIRKRSLLMPGLRSTFLGTGN